MKIIKFISGIFLFFVGIVFVISSTFSYLKEMGSSFDAYELGKLTVSLLLTGLSVGILIYGIKLIRTSLKSNITKPDILDHEINFDE